MIFLLFLSFFLSPFCVYSSPPHFFVFFNSKELFIFVKVEMYPGSCFLKRFYKEKKKKAKQKHFNFSEVEIWAHFSTH